MKYIYLSLILSSFTLLNSCKKEVEEPTTTSQPSTPGNPADPTAVNPIDINNQGFEFLEKMQGHWVGESTTVAGNFSWFSWDYRAISASHIHGIYEGGSMGNLFTSFFVTDFENTRTIMARNGGLLNNIYRSSYFVMDSVSNSASEDFYRLTDAHNGNAIMWMELLFRNDSLYYNVYTSRFGQFAPTLHMTFKGYNSDVSMAQSAALATGFPQNVPAFDFNGGFNESNFYTNPDSELQSATFLAESSTLDVYGLAPISGDPVTIVDYPHIASLQVDVVREAVIDNDQLFVYLSRDPLTDGSGMFISVNAFNTVTQFPEILGSEDQFTFTYLHPGDYYLTVIADENGDFAPGVGDITHSSIPITITPGQVAQTTATNINVQN